VVLLGGGTVESFRESILLSSLFLAVVVQVDGPVVEGVEGSEPPPLMLTLLLRAEAVLFCRRFLAVCCCIIGTGRPGGICKGFINAATGSLFSVAGVGGAFPYRISKDIVPSVVPWSVTVYSFVRGREGKKKKGTKEKKGFLSLVQLDGKKARTKHSRAAKELTCIGGAGPRIGRAGPAHRIAARRFQCSMTR